MVRKYRGRWEWEVMRCNFKLGGIVIQDRPHQEQRLGRVDQAGEEQHVQRP
jgi:hypothetical protein